jgi:hypothetical protein
LSARSVLPETITDPAGSFEPPYRAVQNVTLGGSSGHL